MRVCVYPRYGMDMRGGHVGIVHRVSPSQPIHLACVDLACARTHTPPHVFCATDMPRDHIVENMTVLIHKVLERCRPAFVSTTCGVRSNIQQKACTTTTPQTRTHTDTHTHTSHQTQDNTHNTHTDTQTHRHTDTHVVREKKQNNNKKQNNKKNKKTHTRAHVFRHQKHKPQRPAGRL